MKIIRQGDLTIAQMKMNKIIMFNCNICGCQWEANKNEYEYCGSQRDGDDWKMQCPCCNQMTYNYKKVGW